MKTIRLINLFVLCIIQITSFAQGTLIVSTNGVRYGNIDLDLIYVSPTKDITNAIIIPGANFITKTEGFGTLGYRGNSLAPLSRLLLQFGCSPGGSYNPMAGSASYHINCTGKQFVMVRYSKWSEGGVPIVLSLNNLSQSFFPVYQGSWEKFTTSEWLEFDFPLPVLTVSSNSLTLAALASSTSTFGITSNIGWSVETNQTWLTISKASGSGNATITLSAAVNQSASARSATVTVSGPGVTSKTIYVKQVGTKSTDLTDVEFLRMVQKQTIKYFWDFAHPVSGLIRDRSNGDNNLCATGATGFGLMTLIAASENNYINRDSIEKRILKILKFLRKSESYHGAYPHWMNGETGRMMWESRIDLVETSYLAQGLICTREYFTGNQILSNLADSLWKEIDWQFFLNNEDHLHWHWSPVDAFNSTFPITGFHEAQITYLLAMISPTHPITQDSYSSGWMGQNYAASLNNQCAPLFFTHYSYLGFNPATSPDWILADNNNYFTVSQNMSLFNYNYCTQKGYQTWGLTSSDDQTGYQVHAPCPTSDNGTITPSAAISSIPYTPVQSITTMRYFYDILGDNLWGEYGFKDAFKSNGSWYAASYLGIDQGPEVIMIENYLTGLLWDVCMGAPEWDVLFSTATDIQEIATNSMSVYPIPCKDYIVFGIDTKESQITMIRIYNIEGKLIKQMKQADTKITFDTADLSSGIYIYKIETKFKSKSGTFIKQ
jgi:hypothetical protein